MRRAGRVFAATAAAGFGYLVFLYLTLPDVRPLRTSNPETTAFIELRAREARAKGQTPRRVQQWVSYERISPSITRAVLVSEDDAFWQHEGIDIEQIKESIQADLAKGRLVRGASTITQQLAKNLYLSPSRNPFRKLRELFIARRLEAELSKRRILELYLNEIEWGDGIYGVEAASRAYFGAPAAGVGPDQAALLAGAIVNPRDPRFNPARPSTRLRSRQGLIRARMGDVTPPAADTPGGAVADLEPGAKAAPPAVASDPEPVPEAVRPAPVPGAPIQIEPIVDPPANAETAPSGP
jgi:monofunctional glycosyltransferase